MKFFTLHSENRIGIKELTPVDLGAKESSGQTHIGLYKNVFTHLGDRDVEAQGLLIYGEKCFRLKCYFDRIEKPDGSFRSPKIRKGREGDSIVSRILDITEGKSGKKWFLVWAGLSDNSLVFWLIQKDSSDYRLLQKKDIKLKGTYDNTDPKFNVVKALLEDKLEQTSVSIQKKIEFASQTNESVKIYTPMDIERVNKLIKEIGLKGEEFIDEYLKKKKAEGLICSYQWKNKNRESGEPFDFIVDEGLQTEQYIDVKSTKFQFNHYLYYSNYEIQFIHDLRKKSNYFMYRVYDLNDDYKLKICSDCYHYMLNIHKETEKYKSKIECYNAKLQNAKIAIKPKDVFSIIENVKRGGK